MLARSSAETLRGEWIQSDGNRLKLSHYLESPSVGASAPQAFMVDFPAGTISRPHFHPVDQFQIIVLGEAKIGKQDFAPVCIHYTDAFTPYGPFVAGNRDVKYFTLRPSRSGGTHYMPESRAAMPRKAGRTVQRHYDVMPDAAMFGAWLVARTTIELQDDGLALGCATAPAGERWVDPVSAPGGGRYYLVLSGSLVQEGREFPPWSCMYFARGDAIPSFNVAPGTPCSVAIMQFPRGNATGERSE